MLGQASSSLIRVLLYHSLVLHFVLCSFVNLPCTVMSYTFTFTHHSQLPVLQAPFMVSALYRRYHFLTFILYFYCTFSMFRYTNTIMLLLSTVFSLVCSQVYNPEALCYTIQPSCVVGYTIKVYVSALYDVRHNDEITYRHIFLNISPTLSKA